MTGGHGLVIATKPSDWNPNLIMKVSQYKAMVRIIASGECVHHVICETERQCCHLLLMRMVYKTGSYAHGVVVAAQPITARGVLNATVRPGGANFALHTH